MHSRLWQTPRFVKIAGITPVSIRAPEPAAASSGIQAGSTDDTGKLLADAFVSSVAAGAIVFKVDYRISCV